MTDLRHSLKAVFPVEPLGGHLADLIAALDKADAGPSRDKGANAGGASWWRKWP